MKSSARWHAATRRLTRRPASYAPPVRKSSSPHAGSGTSAEGPPEAGSSSVVFGGEALAGGCVRVEDVERDPRRAVWLGFVHNDILADVGHRLAALRLDAQPVAAVFDRHVSGLVDVERFDVQRPRAHVEQLLHRSLDLSLPLARLHAGR